MLWLRDVVAQDAAVIAAIYAHHVLNCTGSFELDPPDMAEIAKRMETTTTAGFPYIVAELDGKITGYAYAGPYRPRPAYRFTAENSIYVHPDYIGSGVGSLLMAELIDRCEKLGLRQMVAVIGDSANTASLKLHRKFGFVETGLLKDIGYKFGRWLDVVLMQRNLGAGASTPPDFKQ